MNKQGYKRRSRICLTIKHSVDWHSDRVGVSTRLWNYVWFIVLACLTILNRNFWAAVYFIQLIVLRLSSSLPHSHYYEDPSKPIISFVIVLTKTVVQTIARSEIIHAEWCIIFAVCQCKQSSNGNIFRVTGHLCGEFTGPSVNSPHKGQ